MHELIRYFLKEAPELRDETDLKFNVSNILTLVSNKTNISIPLMLSKSRKGEVVLARDYFFVICRQKTDASLSTIGRMVNRDHATVLHGEKTTRNTIQFAKEFNRLFGDYMKVPVPHYFSKPIKPFKPPRVPVIFEVTDNIHSEVKRHIPGIFEESNSIRGFSGYREHSN
jgi:hypothetical protein